MKSKSELLFNLFIGVLFGYCVGIFFTILFINYFEVICKTFIEFWYIPSILLFPTLFIKKYQMKKYREESSRLAKEFKEEVGLKGHEAEERAWRKAYSDGHSSGMLAVFQELEEISEVILG